MTTSESAGTARLVEQLVRVQRGRPLDRPGVAAAPRPGPASGGSACTPRSATAVGRARPGARLASPTMPVAPSRSASCTLTLMLANRTSGLAKMECEPVAKSVSRDPTVSTRSASRARVLVAGVPSRPMPPTCHHAALLHRALAGEGLGDRDAGRRAASALQLGGGVGVDDAAAGDDQRLLRRGEQRGDGGDLVGVRGRAGGSPSPARRRTRPGSRRRGTARPAAATAPRRRSRPGRPGSASPPAAR